MKKCSKRTADAHRDGKRFVVRADEKLTAFVELELESVIRTGGAFGLTRRRDFFKTRRR
jgi:hypothetical protein